MSATPIPEAAQPMADLIREQVKRPDESVVIHITKIGTIRFQHGRRWACPMGLLECATAYDPCEVNDFEESARPDLSDDAIIAFAAWWDEQRDSGAAIAALWGPA